MDYKQQTLGGSEDVPLGGKKKNRLTLKVNHGKGIFTWIQKTLAGIQEKANKNSKMAEIIMPFDSYFSLTVCSSVSVFLYLYFLFLLSLSFSYHSDPPALPPTALSSSLSPLYSGFILGHCSVAVHIISFHVVHNSLGPVTICL